MIEFNGKIVQFGFGAVGKSFFEKLTKEIKFDERNYYVITMDKFEFEAYINLGGIVSNFITAEITRDNFKEIFGKYLSEGDLLIDFADSVGTRDILRWCAENNIMYINTGETDWSDNWYCIFNENKLKNELRKEFKDRKDLNKHPIVLQHGNNPGLVSHFVKAGIEYIVKHQYRTNKEYHKLLKENKFNLLAKKLGIKMVHVNDIDLQIVKNDYKQDLLYSPWCIDSFWFEMLSESTMMLGSHERRESDDTYNKLDKERGFVEFKDLAINTKCHTYYPNGEFDGYLVPHEEIITIADSLEVKEDGDVYRPSVMFIYSPCDYAVKFLKEAKVEEYDREKPNIVKIEETNKWIVRGYMYPDKSEIMYKENIEDGTEYVGILLIGDNFKPVWVGNRIKMNYLYKKQDSYWQTPTITPVAMSALAATCWMIKNKDKGGIYFPDDILEYKDIIKFAEKYISKTIYKTFDKKKVEENLNLNYSDLQSKDLFVKE